MNKNRKLVFISLYVCLAIVLDYIKSFIPFLNMPWGGSINIALIPICVGSFHLGLSSGLLMGILWWLISSLLGLNTMYISILQYICDYVLPSVCVGLCSVVYHKKNIFEIEIGLIIMMSIRLIILVLSGAFFWSNDYIAGSALAFESSFIYNFPYCFFTLIMLMIIVPLIIKSIISKML